MGVLVLGVPTFATVFATDVSKFPGWLKWLLIVLWLAAAILVVVTGVRRDRGIEKINAETIAQRERRREEALDAALRGLLHPDREFSMKWEWTVYIDDADREVLTPAWPRPDGDTAAKEFPYGLGATGQAWEYERTIVRTGAEVHDDTHGLTAAQQDYFKEHNQVVATPIWADDQKFGVLTGIRKDPSREFDSPKDQRHLAAVATAIGTLLKALPRTT